MSQRSNVGKAVALALPLSVASPAKTQRKVATQNQVLAIVCLGIVLANLDLFIVNVGLPNIARDLSDSSFEDLSWILNGYAIVYAALLIFFGRLAERHRRDRSFLLGVALFTAASAACAAAHGIVALVAARLVQAAGAALMTPTSIGLLLATFPPAERGGAVRTWAAIGGLAAALGPVVGGVLILADWRWIFLVNIPIGLAALAVGWWKLPEVAGHDVPRPDPVAAALVTIGIGALTLAIVKGNDWGWTSLAVALSFATSVVCLAIFVRHCAVSVSPFIEPGLFRNRAFTGAALVMGPYSIAFGAALFSVAVWEQTGWHWSALKAGLAIAPGPLLVPVTSLLVGGRLIARFGAAWVIAAGIGFFVAGMVCRAALFRLEPDFLLAALAMVPTGIGVGLTFPTLMGVSASSLPPSSFATGSGAINMIRQAAIAVGVALFVAIASPTATEARLSAFHLGWWVMAAVTALGLVPTFLLIRPVAKR